LNADDMTEAKGTTASEWLENYTVTPVGGTALTGLAAVQHSGQVLFSTLESSDTTALASGSSELFKTEILLGNDQAIIFASVTDGTLSGATALSDLDVFTITAAETTANQATLTSTGGLGLTLNEITNRDQDLDALIGQYQSTAPVLDLASVPSLDSIGASSLTASVEVAREASYDSVVGFYKVTDTSGGVIDSLTGAVINPGDATYAATALATSNLATEFAGLQANDDSTASSTITVTTDSIIAPYAVVGDNTYFAYGAANGENFDRFKALGENSFGLEDHEVLGGDRDYDDLVIRFDFTAA